jgi:hypothetical protein
VLNLALCQEDVWGSGGLGPPLVTSVLVIGEFYFSGVNPVALSQFLNMPVIATQILLITLF